MTLKKFALISGFILSFVLTTSAQKITGQQIPNTPAGQKLNDFLQKFNAHQYHEPRWEKWFSVFGPLDFHSVEESSDYGIRVWTRGKLTKDWFGLRITTKSVSPYDVDQIIVFTGAAPKIAVSRPAKKLLPKQISGQVEAYLNQLAAADYFSGSVLIAKDNTPLFSRAYGFASRRYQIPNKLNAKFSLGSITKMITAVAILQLVEKGKLSLNDPINKYLPNYSNELAKKATIHQLLTHTSGMARAEFDATGIFDRYVRTMDELLAMTVAPPEFEPGTDVRYNNEAWIVLGAIIEKISGQSYYDYVQKNIYTPTGMLDSGAFEGDREIPNIATGYTNLRFQPDGSAEFEPGQRRNNWYIQGIKGTAAGGTYSTVEDLFRFSTALLNYKLLSPKYTKLMMTRHVDIPGFPGEESTSGFGYGFEINNNGRISKMGGSAGVSTRFDLYPEQGYTVIVLSNYDSIGNIVSNHIGELVTGRY